MQDYLAYARLPGLSPATVYNKVLVDIQLVKQQYHGYHNY